MTLPAETDVVVVGGGIAGLAAAGRATELGASVTIVEKADGVGGSTAMSGGWFAFSGTDEQAALGIEDDDASFVADMWAASAGHADPRLLDAYVDRQHAAYRWSKDAGVTYDVVKISSGQSVARSHHTPIGAMIATLKEAALRGPGATLHPRTPMTRLVTDADDGVVAVTVVGDDGRPQDVRARHGVVLATGGFSRSRALLELFVPAQLAAIPHGGLGSTGDGLNAGRRIGADFRDTGFVSGTYGSHPETSDTEHELLTAFYLGAIVVNAAGERFADESRTYKEIGQLCLQQPGGLGVQVFDRVVREQSQPGVPLSDIDHLAAKGHVLEASSLGELADLAGIDADGLAATVDRYNAAVEGRSVDEQGRSALCNGVGDLTTISRPPFYAYPAKTLMTSTYAGLCVSPDAEVLDLDAEPIGGLYAAGEVVGGFHGSSYVTGTALAKGLIFGRAAVDTALSPC
jgi:fumarate reductase flavoprotein subunit